MVARTLGIGIKAEAGLAGLLVSIGLLAACTDGSTSEPENTRSITPLEAHTRGQEAIAACMKEEGFDYRPVVFIETTDRGGIEDYVIDEPDRLGYGALLLAMSDRLYQSPQQFPEVQSDSDLMEYQEALWGPHPEAGEENLVAEGCAAEAAIAVPELALIESSTEDYIDDWYQIIEFDVYLEYSDAWQACLKAEGYERPERDSDLAPVPDSNGPMGAKTAYFYDHLTEFDRAIDESGATIDPSVSSVTVDSLLQIVATDPELTRLLSEEARTASADAKCRETLSSQYFDNYADLLARIEKDDQ